MEEYELFDKNTQAIIYGFQQRAIQRMIDFDYLCKRDTPSVAAVIRPTQGAAVSYHKTFWGSKEIVIPVYKTLQMAMKKHPNANVMINFINTAYNTTYKEISILFFGNELSTHLLAEAVLVIMICLIMVFAIISIYYIFNQIKETDN